MDGNIKEVELLHEAEDIISKHVDVLSPFEAMRLAMILRHLLSYVEDREEQKNE